MAVACLLKLVSDANSAIFCGRKDSANKILNRIIDLNERKYDITALKKNANEDEILRIANLIKKNYGENNNYYTAALLGTFAHHRGISDGIKISVEFALKKSFISNVICTSTLAQGVNLPIKYLIVSSIYQSKEKIKVRDFYNLIGRTGRSGMFTEGTIIFSESFVYKNINNKWKWVKYKELLNNDNSEKCSSMLLELVSPISINKETLNFSQIALLYYTDRNQLEDKITELINGDLSNEIKEALKEGYARIIKTLGSLESYIATIISDNDNSYSAIILDEMLKSTLAYSLASEQQKEDLKKLFEVMCLYIEKTLPSESDKRCFSKSLISSSDFVSLQNDVIFSNVLNFDDEELLNWLIEMIYKYGKTKLLSKLENNSQMVTIANMWMDGDSYYEILNIVPIHGLKIYKRKKYCDITLEDIIEICDGDFGYISSIIVDSICEILLQADEDNTYSTTVEILQRIGQQLKYGLANQTEVFVFELGFNDRFIAQEISKIIGIHHKKRDVKSNIKKNRQEIKDFLQSYPSVYLNRLSSL